MEDLKAFVKNRVKELGDQAAEYFGVDRKTIISWKKGKFANIPFAAAEAVFANEDWIIAPQQGQDVIPTPPTSGIIPDPQFAPPGTDVELQDGTMVPASSIRPSGGAGAPVHAANFNPTGPRVVQPLVALERHSGLQIANHGTQPPQFTQLPNGAMIDNNLLAGIAALLGGGFAGGPVALAPAPALVTGAVAPRPDPRLPQGSMQIRPTRRGRTWMKPKPTK